MVLFLAVSAASRLAEFGDHRTHLFAGVASPIEVGRYHSLVIDPAGVPDGFRVTATVEGETTIMGIRHESKPIFGVQFHPESVLTPGGYRMLQNFLEAQ